MMEKKQQTITSFTLYPCVFPSVLLSLTLSTSPTPPRTHLSVFILKGH